MSSPEIIFTCAVLLVGLPGSFWNRTAAALVVSWCLQELVWLISGEFIPPMGGVILDYGILITILTKPEVRDCSPYRTLGQQLWAFWCERSWNDGVVLSIFPLMWLSHLMLDDYYGWWVRWWLALAQILVAGVEALGPFLRRLVAIPDAAREPPPDTMRRGLAGYV